MPVSFRLAAVFFLLSAALVRAEDTQGLVLPVKSVSVSSPVLQEVIDAVLVEEGAEVKEGQVLVQLRDAKEKLQVAEGERMVENADFVAKGAGSLFDQKMGSKEQMLKSKTEWELAKIRRDLAQELLKEKTICAPLSGIVVKKYKEAGESVDRVEKLIDIIDIDEVFVQFYLPPKLLPAVAVEQPISVRFPDLNDSVFNGKINYVEPRIDASSGLFRVKVLLENPGHKIKAGMRGFADFTKKRA